MIEAHQGSLRLANSRVELNASGLATGDRSGRGGNDAAAVFIRGAQPILVGNDFRFNLGAVVSIDVNSLTDVYQPDSGRTSGAIDRYEGYDDNFGPLVRDNRITTALPIGRPIIVNPIAGMVVRGGLLTIESVWDDTDIVSVVQDEILVGNFHTATGLRLVSAPDASLVVKLDGTDAGFTASGYALDINNRIGGTVQVIGRPGYPVIMTSLADDSVGAGLDPIGMTVTDTNADGALTRPMPGDWRSLQFLPFSNDLNVKVVLEFEGAYTGGSDPNGIAASAESLGVLAPNYPTGTNTWDSASEKSGDDNRRLGFEVQGSIALDNPGDVDIYSFVGYAGSEVWIDLDKTSSALDTMV